MMPAHEGVTGWVPAGHTLQMVVLMVGVLCDVCAVFQSTVQAREE